MPEQCEECKVPNSSHGPNCSHRIFDPIKAINSLVVQPFEVKKAQGLIILDA